MPERLIEIRKRQAETGSAAPPKPKPKPPPPRPKRNFVLKAETGRPFVKPGGPSTSSG
jgi:hypothetical protein